MSNAQAKQDNENVWTLSTECSFSETYKPLILIIWVKPVTISSLLHEDETVTGFTLHEFNCTCSV